MSFNIITPLEGLQARRASEIAITWNYLNVKFWNISFAKSLLEWDFWWFLRYCLILKFFRQVEHENGCSSVIIGSAFFSETNLICNPYLSESSYAFEEFLTFENFSCNRWSHNWALDKTLGSSAFLRCGCVNHVCWRIWLGRNRKQISWSSHELLRCVASSCSSTKNSFHIHGTWIDFLDQALLLLRMIP